MPAARFLQHEGQAEELTKDDLGKSIEAGNIVEVEVSGVAADSLGARRVGTLMFPIAQQFVAQALLVTDEQILQAQKMLWQQLRLVAEPGGVTALAALIAGVYRSAEGERVGAVICRGNAELSRIPVGP